MLYQAYQTHSDVMEPVRTWASTALRAIGQPLAGIADNAMLRNLTAAYELIARAGLTHDRPAFGIDTVTVGNREVAVHERAAFATPFGTLLHFKKDVDIAQPRVLLVAPLSGHFATLLRGTVRTLLPEHDVYITDWHNVRDVALTHGRFGFDEYIEHLIRFLEAIGPGAHVIAVCQPCVAALVATAVMAQMNHAATPRSMTLMAGPIDCRVNPTKVNALANSKPIGWFEQNLIAAIPMRYPGAFRRVYPGFVQLAAFMSMNIERHLKAHRELYDNIARGEHTSTTNTSPCSISPPSSIWRPSSWCSRNMPSPPASLNGRATRSSRAPSSAPCCSRSRASATTSAQSGRLRPRTTYARGCARISGATTCRPAWGTTASSAATAGPARSIRWCATSFLRASDRAPPIKVRARSGPELAIHDHNFADDWRLPCP
jgi:polyhydroxyalkanoate depolymerase